MIVLALDTTTRRGSLALARHGVVLEVVPLPEDAPVATRVPGDVGTLLARHAIAMDQVEAFAVAAGPGSFTGLRIGVASMQGLAFACRRPLIGVSGLDALAVTAGADGTIVTWVDAWRGEVYAESFRNGAPTGEPTVDQPRSLLTAMEPSDGGNAVRFIGDGAERYRALIESLHSGWMVEEPATPLLAGAVARLAVRRLEAGESGAPCAVRPLYVRRPDAELLRSARRGHKQRRT